MSQKQVSVRLKFLSYKSNSCRKEVSIREISFCLKNKFLSDFNQRIKFMSQKKVSVTKKSFCHIKKFCQSKKILLETKVSVSVKIFRHRSKFLSQKKVNVTKKKHFCRQDMILLFLLQIHTIKVTFKKKYYRIWNLL